MGNFRTELFWVLACIGVIYLAVDVFSEGSTSAYVAGIGAFILTVMLVTKNKE